MLRLLPLQVTQKRHGISITAAIQSQGVQSASNVRAMQNNANPVGGPAHTHIPVDFSSDVNKTRVFCQLIEVKQHLFAPAIDWLAAQHHVLLSNVGASQHGACQWHAPCTPHNHAPCTAHLFVYWPTPVVLKAITNLTNHFVSACRVCKLSAYVLCGVA